MVNFNAPVNPAGSYDPCFMRTLEGGWNTCIYGRPCQKGANVLNNCVGWAQGRALQIYRQVADCFPEDGENIFSIFNCDPENFLYRAKQKGFEIVSKPCAGSIFVTNSHVGIVEWKEAAGWLISESGYDYDGPAVLFQHSIYEDSGRWFSSFANPEKLILGFIKIPKVKDNLEWSKVWVLQDGTRLLKGWQKVKGLWYYMDQNGSMLTGWQKIGSYWYYLSDATGEMLLGWQQLKWKNKTDWYYFDKHGHMVTGTQTINGKVYHFDASGRWLGN